MCNMCMEEPRDLGTDRGTEIKLHRGTEKKLHRGTEMKLHPDKTEIVGAKG